MFLKTKFIIALLILDIAGICALLYKPEWTTQKTIASEARRVKIYSHPSTPPVHFGETRDVGPKEIEISFRVKIGPFKDHPNILQTAPYNEGLRLEMTEATNLGIVVAQKKGEPLGFNITSTLTLNTWHTIAVHFDRYQHLTVDLDGARVVDVSNSALRPKISDVAVGSGFSGRIFTGTLEDFKLSYRLYKGPSPKLVNRITKGLYGLGVFLTFYLLVLMTRTAKQTLPQKTSYAVAAMVCIGLLVSTSIFKKALTWKNLLPANREEVQFDSRSKRESVAAFKEYTVKASDIKNIDIRFGMKPYSFSNYPNVFQTADYNEGIRMEIDAAGNAGLLLGHLMEGEIKGSGSFPLKIGEWYSIIFRIVDEEKVSIQVDGNTVYSEHIPGGLRFDVSTVLVGSGFAKKRPFDGAIRHFELRYQDPQRIKLLYCFNAVLLILTGLFLFHSRHMLISLVSSVDAYFNIYRSSDKKRFFVKCVLLLLPVSAYLGSIEWHLQTMETNYSQKRSHFEKRLSEIEILILGSSNAFYGINPKVLSYPAFNLAYRGQALYYDAQILQRYLKRMPQLKVVVIPIIYLTFGTHQYQVDAPRAYLYQHYWGISPESRPRHGLDLEYRLDPKRFSLISTYGDRTPGYMMNGYKEILDPDPETTGWFDSGSQVCDVSLNIGPDGARAHNLMVKGEHFDQNVRLLQDMIDRLKKRNILPILIQLPLHRVYTDYVDKAKWQRMEEVLQSLALKNGVTYLDYTFDNRFSISDFTNLPDHLNATGAEKFTRILDAAIIEQRLPTHKPDRLKNLNKTPA